MAQRTAREPASTSLTVPAGFPPLPDLPDAAVACILQHVLLCERLAKCALVCRAWAAATATAPAEVNIELKDSKHCEHVEGWLGKHAGMVTSLIVSGPSGTWQEPDTWRSLQLPIPQLTQLRSLDLSYVKGHMPVQGLATHNSIQGREGPSLTVTSSSAGSSSSSTVFVGSGAAVLPQLQQLKLAYCQLPVQLASQLLSCTALTKLRWHCAELHTDGWTGELPQHQTISAMCTKLMLLPKLSALKLRLAPEKMEHWTDEPVSLAPISTLQSLQTLRLQVESHKQVAAVAAVLPIGLTRLQVNAGFAVFEPGTAAPSELCLARLTNLKSFTGEWVCMRPSSLGRMTWLRDVHLTRPCSADGSQWAPQELLAALQPLTQMQDLELQKCRLYKIVPQPEVGQTQQGDSRCFSALTASTQLTALFIWEDCDMPLPQSAFDHMFPAGRVLPNLRETSIGTSYTSKSCEYCVDAAQVARIAASCPALQELELDGVTSETFDCKCLLQLPLGVTEVMGLNWVRLNL